MPTYAVYSTAGNAVAWLSTQPAPPTPPAGMAYLEVPDGTALGSGKWDVVSGALVAHAPSFAENQAAKGVAAQARYATVAAAGFTYAGNLYAIDAGSLANMAAMGSLALGSITAASSAGWPSGFAWETAAGALTPMDAPTMYGFAEAVAHYVYGCFIALRAIKAAVAAATTQDALDAIDVTAGYPAASG